MWFQAHVRNLLLACLAIALGACSSEAGEPKACYSPSQNAESALDEGARGCVCGGTDEAQCVHTEAHGDVAFFCANGHWQSGFDGPCQPVVQDCYSPAQNLEHAYDQGAEGCACGDGDADQCIEGVALICSAGSWQAVEDGPCAPQGPMLTCISPTQDETLLREELKKWPSLGLPGCACDVSEQDVCVAGFGLNCHEGFWRVGLDGPCGPPAKCYSPSQNAALAGDPNAVGCACNASDPDVCVEELTLSCKDGRWHSLKDGPCSKQALRCEPQKAHWEGLCPGAQFFYWQGSGCVAMTGCRCTGRDCAARFQSEATCLAAFAQCPSPRACGGWAGNTCSAQEYCAYTPEVGGCGLTDGQSVCAPRPTACDDDSARVCGCDGRTYANECEANRAGSGVYSFGSCRQN